MPVLDFDTGFGAAWLLGNAIMGLLYDKWIPALILLLRRAPASCGARACLCQKKRTHQSDTITRALRRYRQARQANPIRERPGTKNTIFV
jgi:hypothetical protein